MSEAATFLQSRMGPCHPRVGIVLGSGLGPEWTVTKPPACMTRSNDDRSTMRSRTTGNALDRHGSMVIFAPSVNRRMYSGQVAAPRDGPWG